MSSNIPRSANKVTPWQKTERSKKWFGVIMGVGMAGPVIGSGVAVLKDAPVAAGVLLLVGGLAGIVWLTWSRRQQRAGPVRRFPMEALTTGALCPKCGERVFHKVNPDRAAEAEAEGVPQPKPVRLVCTGCGNDLW